MQNRSLIIRCDGGIAPLDPRPFDLTGLLEFKKAGEIWNKPWHKDWNEIYKNYPLYGFILYSNMDDEILDFVRCHGGWLHALIGRDCLIGVFENASDWGPQWNNYWQKALGKESGQLIEMWNNLRPFERNHSYRIAENLGIDKNALPCIVILESYSAHKILYIPIISDAGERNLQRFFQDLFTSVQYASTSSQGQKLKNVKKKWRWYGMKWKLWSVAKISVLHGSMIIQTTKEIKDIIRLSK